MLILVCSGGASANSDDGKASLSLEGADAGDKDVYLSHSCIHDEILHQRRRAGRKEYSVMPQVYHVPREKVERIRGRQLLGVSSWRAPRSNVKKPIRIYLNYDAVGHSPDRDCKNVGDIVKVGLVEAYDHVRSCFNILVVMLSLLFGFASSVNHLYHQHQEHLSVLLTETHHWWEIAGTIAPSRI